MTSCSKFIFHTIHSKQGLNTLKPLENVGFLAYATMESGKWHCISVMKQKIQERELTVSSVSFTTTSLNTAMAKSVYLHADNCVGQNKNNASIQYLVWRVLNGYEESIELSFMLVGHTKFSPDHYFGLFKKVFHRSSVSTLAEISAVAERATSSGQIVPQVIRDVAGKKLVIFYQWSTYLCQFFCTIPNITSYHNFKVSADGTVTVKQYSDSSEEKIKLLKPNV